MLVLPVLRGTEDAWCMLVLLVLRGAEDAWCMPGKPTTSELPFLGLLSFKICIDDRASSCKDSFTTSFVVNCSKTCFAVLFSFPVFALLL